VEPEYACADQDGAIHDRIGFGRTVAGAFTGALNCTGYRQAEEEPASKAVIIGIAVACGVLAMGVYLLFTEERDLGMPLAFVTGLRAILFATAWFGTSGVPLASSRI